MKTQTLKQNIKHALKKNTAMVVPNERTFLYNHLSQFAKTQTGKNILEIGAGHQQYRHLFEKENNFEACDLKDGFHPEKKPDFYASIYDIPRAENHYDLVLMFQVLEHLEFPVKALGEVNRILKAAGKVYLSVPQAAGDHFDPHHYFNYTQYGLRSVLSQAGFQIVEHQRLAGIFVYVGNRLLKLGAITYKQYEWSKQFIQKFLASIFYGFCCGLGYLISLFNFIDAKKHYCIGHIVVAQKVQI